MAFSQKRDGSPNASITGRRMPLDGVDRPETEPVPARRSAQLLAHEPRRAAAPLARGPSPRRRPRGEGRGRHGQLEHRRAAGPPRLRAAASRQAGDDHEDRRRRQRFHRRQRRLPGRWPRPRRSPSRTRAAVPGTRLGAAPRAARRRLPTWRRRAPDSGTSAPQAPTTGPTLSPTSALIRRLPFSPLGRYSRRPFWAMPFAGYSIVHTLACVCRRGFWTSRPQASCIVPSCRPGVGCLSSTLAPRT